MDYQRRKWRKLGFIARAGQLSAVNLLEKSRKDRRLRIPKDTGHHLHSSTLHWHQLRSLTQPHARRKRRRQLEASVPCPCASNKPTQAVSQTCNLLKSSGTSYLEMTRNSPNMSIQACCWAFLIRTWCARAWYLPWHKCLALDKLRITFSCRQGRQFRIH